MQFELTKNQTHTTLSIDEPRLDASQAGDLQKVLTEVINDNEETTVILDLSKLEFMDSTGLGTVVLAKKLLGDEGDLRIVGIHGAVSELFRMTRMDRILKIYDDLESAEK